MESTALQDLMQLPFLDKVAFTISTKGKNVILKNKKMLLTIISRMV